MDFMCGITCWHVVGYENGDAWRPRILCGWKPDEAAIGGNALDVIHSQMNVCRSCNRSTNGEALRWVRDVLATESQNRSEQ